MNLSRIAGFVVLLLIALTMGISQADGHKHHRHVRAATPASATNQLAPADVAAPKQDQLTGMTEETGEDRSTMSTSARLLNWLGRLHPAIVHFPIAFFPAALFVAILGRRRQALGKSVRFLVVAGGIIAPIAAILGWLDAMSADLDPLLTVHRWLGTVIGIVAFGFAIWAWKRPESDRSTGMLIGLAFLTAAIIVQGWYGGAMVHGVDHMNW